MNSWPHGPVHRLTERGIYMVTAGTYRKDHHFGERRRLRMLQSRFFELADEHGWRLDAWAFFSNHYHFVGHSPEDPDSLRVFLSTLHTLTARDMNKIDQILVQLNITEKVSLLAGADLWQTVGIDRLGIPPIKVSDGPIGVRGTQGTSSPPSTCFPAPVAMGATWNPDLIEQVGSVLALEAMDKGVCILLAPMVNIQRSPLAGRNFECYSEDPYLTGRLAIAYISGLQEGGVGACIKHYVCNDSEFERMSISSEVDQRTLREIYLLPFEMAISAARPWTIMSAYNKLNGVYCSENSEILLDILKEEWGFDGPVMSDWMGTYSKQAAPGGLDLEMPGPARWMGDDVLQALETGELSEEQLDDKVRRILTVIDRAGARVKLGMPTEKSMDRPEHRRLTRRVAAESIVLLKNDGMLPLSKGMISSIAVIGENAKWRRR